MNAPDWFAWFGVMALFGYAAALTGIIMAPVDRLRPHLPWFLTGVGVMLAALIFAFIMNGVTNV